MKWYIILILSLLFLLALLLLSGYIMFRMIVLRKPYSKNDLSTEEKKKYYNFKDSTTNALQSMNMEEIYITSFDGLKLHAYYKEARIKTNKTIISVHGHDGGAFRTAPQFSHWLVDFNYNILFIDLRSYGLSEGKYIGFGALDYKDLLSWIDYLLKRFNKDVSIALFGLSMGGNTVLNCSDKAPRQVKCIIDDCGFTSPYEEFKAMSKAKKLPTFLLPFASLFSKFIAHYGFKEGDARKAVSNSKVPILFIHGDKDTFVPTDMGLENYDYCTSKKEIKIFKNAAHARSYYYNMEGYKKVVLDFLALNL